MEDELKTKMSSFYSARGLQMGMSPSAIGEALNKLMGPKRFKALGTLCKNVERGKASPQKRYEFFRSAAEMNTFISIQAEVFLDVSRAVYSAIQPHLVSGTKLLDLGCGAGHFASWVASNHLTTEVIGVDVNSRAITIARESNQVANLEFVQWNYSQNKPWPIAPCNVLISIFGIEFGTGGNNQRHPRNIAHLRNSAQYRCRKQESIPYFVSWRRAVVPGGTMLVALRISSLEYCLGVIDAAHEAGWNVVLSTSELVAVGDERFPVLACRPELAEPPSPARVAMWFSGDQISLTYGEQLGDPNTFVLDQTLADKPMVSQRE
jgi:SAM-dependent methyltransferase